MDFTYRWAYSIIMLAAANYMILRYGRAGMWKAENEHR